MAVILFFQNVTTFTFVITAVGFVVNFVLLQRNLLNNYSMNITPKQNYFLM